MPLPLPPAAIHGLALCLAAVAVLPGSVHAGTVRTISGETFEGDVHLDNGAVTITVKGQPAQRVDLANVLRADFSVKKADLASEGIGPGVQLRSGGLVGGKVSGVDTTTVHMMAAGQAQDFPLTNVARLVFSPLPETVAHKIPAGFVGAVLPGGDLFEGEYRGMEEKPPQVKINSPFLGVHRFGLKNEILAVVLHDVAPVPPDAYRVQSTDGSAYGTTSLQPSGDMIMLHDPLAGDVKIPGKQLALITAGPARVLPMGTLHAQAVGSVLPAKVPAVFLADSLPAGGSITMAGHSYDGGVAQAAGVSVTYAVPQGFSVFTAQAGLPEGATPGTAVVFALLVDGRPAWRSTPVAAGAPPVPVRWNLGTSAHTLTLSAEPAQSTALGTVSAWGDAALLKP